MQFFLNFSTYELIWYQMLQGLCKTTEKSSAGRLEMSPPLEIDDLERSHRLGRRADKDGRPRTRAIIVRFRSERVRDEVFRARTKLKSHNAERRTDKIFINDDLTPRRAKLSFDARASKRANKITDCWTAYGRVMIKDLTGKVLQLNSASDLPR